MPVLVQMDEDQDAEDEREEGKDEFLDFIQPVTALGKRLLSPTSEKQPTAKLRLS